MSINDYIVYFIVVAAMIFAIIFLIWYSSYPQFKKRYDEAKKEVEEERKRYIDGYERMKAKNVQSKD
jgi:F0F1-type ATP synthase membrane subunit b/b'